MNITIDQTRVVLTLPAGEAELLAGALRYLAADQKNRSWACNGGKSRDLSLRASQNESRAARILAAVRDIRSAA